MKKYEVIDEYEHFYLCISKNGYRECFDKVLYKPDSEGFIYVKEDNNIEGHSISSEKINRTFNGGLYV